jgi:hypothetical protein
LIIPIIPQISTSRDTFPNVSNISLLTAHKDWGTWHEAVLTLLDNLTISNHICDPLSPYLTIVDPDLIPSYPPVLRLDHTPNELAAWSAWWKADGIASHILTSRLSESVRGVLPPRCDPSSGAKRTAREVLHVLQKNFGIGDWSHASTLKSRLFALKATHQNVESYVHTYCRAIAESSSSGFPIPLLDLLQHFVDNLPSSSSYNIIRDWLHLFLN